MAFFTLTQDFYGHGFKLGSTWAFQFARKAGMPPPQIQRHPSNES